MTEMTVQEDMVCLSCTGTGERVCLSAEGFGNRQCFLESIVDKVSGKGQRIILAMVDFFIFQFLHLRVDSSV